MDKKKILIIEDAEDLVRIVGLQLRMEGYDVVCATDVVTAITAAQEERPDLILLDLGLPAGDGFSVMKRLAGFDRTLLTPIVVITGRDQSTDKEQALEAGAEAFFEKPVDIDELLAVIRNILGDGSESSANAENTVKTE